MIKPGEIFDVYANDRNFLFAAFLFEDVGVTAFKGAAPFISNKTYLDAAAGMLATEAYHAGIVRATLFNEGLMDDSVFDVVHKISAVRNAVSGPADDDQDLGTKDVANLVPNDEYGRVFGRSAAEILNIVYLDSQGEPPEALPGWAQRRHRSRHRADRGLIVCPVANQRFKRGSSSSRRNC